MNTYPQKKWAPLLAELEALRLSHKTAIDASYRGLFVVLFFTFGSTALLLAGQIGLGIGLAVVALIILLVVIFGIIRPAHKAFKHEFKNKAYQAIAQTLHPNIHYDPASYIPKTTFQQSALFSIHGSYRGEDYFEGTTETGTPFRFSELRVTQQNKNSETTIFRGLFFEFDLQYSASSAIKIIPDLAERALGNLGKLMQKKVGGLLHKGADLVYFEKDPEFEKRFVVYAEEETAARQILSPALRKAILRLQEQHKMPLHVSLVGDRLYLAFSLHKNLFQPKLKESVMDPPFLERTLQELAIGFDLVKTVEQWLLLLGNPNATSDEPDKIALPKRHGVSYKKSSSKDNPFFS